MRRFFSEYVANGRYIRPLPSRIDAANLLAHKSRSHRVYSSSSKSKPPTQNPKLSAKNRLKSILSEKFSFKMGSRSRSMGVWTTPKAENNPDPYKVPSRSSSVVQSKIPKWPQKGLRAKSNNSVEPKQKEERRRSMVFIHEVVDRVGRALKRPGGGNNQSKSPLIIPTERDRQQQQPEAKEREEFLGLAKNGLTSHQVIPKRTSAPFQPQDSAIYPSLRLPHLKPFNDSLRSNSKMTIHNENPPRGVNSPVDHQMSFSSSGGDPDSDAEDDPGQLLNAWLGHLNTLNTDLDQLRPLNDQTGSGDNTKQSSSVVRRKPKAPQDRALQNQYRCSLINLENTQDEELDAILDELNVLGTQFDEEIAVVDKQMTALSAPDSTPSSSKVLNEKEGSSGSSSSGLHSRSDSGGSVDASGKPSSTNQNGNQNGPSRLPPGQRTDSPDNDSAFCDNLSMLSSCSASSSSRTDQSKSSSGVSSTTSPTSSTSPDEEARIIKAEKMKLAIEKIKEASIKKVFIKVFTADGSAKSLLIDERMSVGHVTRILAEKNHVKLDPKWTLVELVPDLYMERVYEDNENLVENCLMWKMDSKNTLWFIERPEKFDLFVRPELYLLGTSSSQKGELLEEHSRQELLEEYFSSSGVGAPELEGFVWLKSESKKAWKKHYFVLRSSGLYYAPKDGKKSSKDLICLSTFDVNQVYFGAGWKKKYKSPTDFCFAIKHPQIQAKAPKYIKYLCVDSDRELQQWVTGIRIAKNGRQLFDNYRAIEEEITHADIDLLTSKRYSVNSPNSLQIPCPLGTNGSSQNDSSSPARTPSSENKSLDSALSSGIVSDMSQCSGLPSSSSSSASFQNSCEGSSETSSSQNTPVNTIERGGLRRSMSRTSKSSSSSGCLSDKSSLPGGIEHGFESDFPAGGTIKKRPTVSPRIPLTSTTWGMVRDSDEESNDPTTPNVRVGGGGTLLRSAVRQSFRKHSRSGSDMGQLIRTMGSESPIPNQTVMAEVHQHPSDIDPMSAEFESSFGNDALETSLHEDLPLPPPPRDESLDRLSQSTMDDLPPPPPELIPEINLPHHRPPLPPTLSNSRLPPSGRPACVPLPPSLKKFSPSPLSLPKRLGNTTRRISFDDNVQLIDDDSLSFQRAPNPNKLYPNGANCSEAAPPKEFISHLQQVMNKKWQIAEKCRVNTHTTPHQVLGFRDDVQHIVGTPQDYGRDESVGAWVLQSQQFAPEPGTMSEPLYAIASKSTNPNQSPCHYAPSNAPAQIPGGRPVILREPTPEFDPYSTLQEVRNGHETPERKDVSNYSTINFVSPPGMMNRMCPSPQLSPSHRGSFRSKATPPPPPRRSENTQLSCNPPSLM